MPSKLSWLIAAAGVFDVVLAVFHLTFWRILRWDDELQRLGEVNRGVVQVLNLALTFLFAFIGGMLLLFPADLAATGLGRFLLLGMSAFWLVRAIYQPMFFTLRHPLSVVLLVVFLAGSIVHGAAWFLSLG